MSSEFRVIGKRQPKLDGFEKVTGRAKYASDFSLPGMLHLKILRSPYPHARIVSIDTSKALGAAGSEGGADPQGYGGISALESLPTQSSRMSPASRATTLRWSPRWMRRRLSKRWA